MLATDERLFLLWSKTAVYSISQISEVHFSLASYFLLRRSLKPRILYLTQS